MATHYYLLSVILILKGRDRNGTGGYMHVHAINFPLGYELNVEIDILEIYVGLAWTEHWALPSYVVMHCYLGKKGMFSDLIKEGIE